MEVFSTLNNLHFIRPQWLWMLLPAALLMASVYRRSDTLKGWRKAISPRLLNHLLLEDQQASGRWRPVYLLGVSWLIGIIALAGPSWKMQPSPFSEDQAALYIVLKVTPEMRAQDIQPDRLQRSVMKIHDLLEIKSDLRSGLIAYAGSPHLVMPLTRDREIINNFAAALTPEIMPKAGDDPAAALLLAGQRLKKAAVPGSILLITDRLEASQLDRIKSAPELEGIRVQLLAVAADSSVIPPANSPAAPALDMDTLKQAAGVLDASVTRVSADKSDVEEVAASLTRSLRNAPQEDGAQWQDAGYYLVPLLLLLMLTFFRRGGAVSIE